LQKNHAAETELLVGFYNKSSGKGGLEYFEAVDQALCFGWIDGVRKKIHADSCYQRYTPRKKGSTWSLRNVGRVEALRKEGQMTPAGEAAFALRSTKKTGIYSAENRDKAVLDAASEKRFRANKKAWEFFQSRPPSYKTPAIWLIVSAKKPETREKRLRTLIEDSACGRTIKQLTRKKKAA
ncbi:MAG TPA: YdeI/OmpD-associated family protein, partial [Candidatus Peribacteria bacterium]|nr:YdeI/OmpD-associated family protein [Candidatus Peribacteria bacterium]